MCKSISTTKTTAGFALTLHSWAIRNCGLLLLRSLIDCLFGTSEAKAITDAGWDGRSIRINYDYYPALPSILIKLISSPLSFAESNEDIEKRANMSVFPALDIIRRAGPPAALRDEIFRTIAWHLDSKVWHIREVTARTLATLLLHDGWEYEINCLLEWSFGNVNRIHGVLMTLTCVLARRATLDLGDTLSKCRCLPVFLGNLTKLNLFQGL